MQQRPGTVIGVAGGLVDCPASWLALCLAASAGRSRSSVCVADASAYGDISKLLGRWRPGIQDISHVGLDDALVAGPDSTAVLLGPQPCDATGAWAPTWRSALPGLRERFEVTFVALSRVTAAGVAGSCDAAVVALGRTSDTAELERLAGAAPGCTWAHLCASEGGGELEAAARVACPDSTSLGAWPRRPRRERDRAAWDLARVLGGTGSAADATLARLWDVVGRGHGEVPRT